MTYGTFNCARCGQFKPIAGRKKYKPSGRKESRGRVIWEYQCKECAKEAQENAISD